MSDDPFERYLDATTVEIPFVLVPAGGNPVTALDGGIVDAVAIPIRFEPAATGATPNLERPDALTQAPDQDASTDADQPRERRIPGSIAPIDR